MPVLSSIWEEINKTPIAINRTAPVTACYQHNAMGERVNKGGSGSSQTFFLFDPAGRLVGDYLENLATLQSVDWLLQQETVWFGEILVAVI